MRSVSDRHPLQRFHCAIDGPPIQAQIEPDLAGQRDAARER